MEGESTTVSSDGHPTGRGLHEALVAAVRDARMREADVSWRVSDLNGEQYGGIDSALAMSSFYRTHRPHLEIVHPAEGIGEIGAGIGALLVSYAIVTMQRGYAKGPVAMCETSAERGERACAVVTGAPAS